MISIVPCFLLPMPFPALAALSTSWLCIHKPGVGEDNYFEHWKVFQELKSWPPPERTGMWGVKKHRMQQQKLTGGVGSFSRVLVSSSITWVETPPQQADPRKA